MSKQPIPLKKIFEIPGADHIPNEWKPFEFVVANLTYEYFSNGIIDFNFDSVKYYSGGDFEAFVAALKSHHLPAPNVPPKPAETIHPLEIVVREYCWVFVTLDVNKRMRFRSRGSAITAKENYGINNCALVHFDRDFTQLPDPPGDGCFAAAFAVVSRGLSPGVDHNFINLHLELEQTGGRGWLEIALDPDVPDDGGTPPYLGPGGLKRRGSRALSGPSKEGGSPSTDDMSAP